MPPDDVFLLANILCVFPPHPQLPTHAHTHCIAMETPKPGSGSGPEDKVADKTVKNLLSFKDLALSPSSSLRCLQSPVCAVFMPVQGQPRTVSLCMEWQWGC